MIPRCTLSVIMKSQPRVNPSPPNIDINSQKEDRRRTHLHSGIIHKPQTRKENKATLL